MRAVGKDDFTFTLSIWNNKVLWIQETVLENKEAQPTAVNRRSGGHIVGHMWELSSELPGETELPAARDELIHILNTKEDGSTTLGLCIIQ